MPEESDEKNTRVNPPALRYSGQMVVMWAAVVGLSGLIIGGCIGFGFGYHMRTRSVQAYPMSDHMNMPGM